MLSTLKLVLRSTLEASDPVAIECLGINKVILIFFRLWPGSALQVRVRFRRKRATIAKQHRTAVPATRRAVTRVHGRTMQLVSFLFRQRGARLVTAENSICRKTSGQLP